MTAVGMRTDWCGELTTADEGREVVLCGWVATRREHGEHLAFVDVRDRTGVIQCVVPGADDLRSEYVVKVTGTVRHRPEGTTNPDLATGEVELGDCRVEVLATADALPFPISDRIDADESLRLRHRYLDLRRSRLQANLGPRATVNLALRNAMAGPGLHRDRDADAHRLDPGGRPRLRRAVPAAPRRVLRPAPEPAALQAALHGRRGWSATSRSPAACGTRTCGPTASSSSPSSTSRPASWARPTSGRFTEVAVVRRGRGRHRRAAAVVRVDHLARRHGALRQRQARHPLRHGAGRAHRGLRRHRVQGLPGAVREGHPGAGRGRQDPPGAGRAWSRPPRPSGPRAWCG